MVARRFLFAVLVLLVGAAVGRFDSPRDDESTLLPTWDQALKTAVTPVTKVVHLLKERQATLKKEMDDEEEIYVKLDCWCTTYDTEKTDAIAQAEATISQLESSIEALTACDEELRAQIKELEAELQSRPWRT